MNVDHHLWKKSIFLVNQKVYVLYVLYFWDICLHRKQMQMNGILINNVKEWHLKQLDGNISFDPITR